MAQIGVVLDWKLIVMLGRVITFSDATHLLLISLILYPGFCMLHNNVVVQVNSCVSLLQIDSYPFEIYAILVL